MYPRNSICEHIEYELGFVCADYAVAVSVHDDDKKYYCLRQMSHLMASAAEMFGFDYADELKRRFCFNG